MRRRDEDLAKALAFLALIALAILALRNSYFLLNALFLSIIFGGMAMAYNLISGYGGQLSLGHVVFFGVGAYATAVLDAYYGVTPWIGIFVGGALAGLAGVAVGIPLFRLRSHWFTLGSIAVGEMFRVGFINWPYVNSAAGIQLPIRGGGYDLYWMISPGAEVYSYIALAILALEIAILRLVVRSDIGLYLQAIREDETVASAMGIPVLRYKLAGLGISGLFVGVFGGLYMERYRFIDPDTGFSLLYSIQIALAAIIGGMGRLYTPLLGALIIMPASEYTRSVLVQHLGAAFLGIHLLIYGSVLLAFVLLMPGGLAGLIETSRFARAGWLRWLIYSR